MIGADFEKIQFVLFGLELVEPMAIITDTILGGLSLFYGFKLLKIQNKLAFYTYWKWFFIVFGVGAFVGGLGHTFINQWGVIGKFPSWLCGPLSVYCLEQAMISIYPNEKKFEYFKLASTLKMIACYAIFFYIYATQPIAEKIELPFLPIAINTILGVSLTAGLLGLKYTKLFTAGFNYFYLGVLVMIPSAFIFLMKINLHQWFDKNDLSHVLMAAGITYFYFGIKNNVPTFKEIFANK